MRAIIFVLVAAAASAQQAPEVEPPVSVEQLEQQHLRQLLTLRRVYVDRLTGGDTAAQIRDMVIAALQRSRLFIVTEDESRADAYIRGSGEDLIYSEVRASREGLNVRAGGRLSSRDRTDSSAVTGTMGAGESEDHYSRERKHEATASVRLVSRDGDVLWSTTQESNGAKYKGSSADVAEKITKELAAAYAKAKKLNSNQPSVISHQQARP
jgi:hypothetical protein